MGCVQGKHDESGRKEHAIYYLIKKFTNCETRYSLLNKTCCALAWASRRLRQYMLNHTTLLISNMDLIKYIFEGSVLADHLAHQDVDDYQSMNFEFPDENIMLVTDCEKTGLDEGPEKGS